MAMAALSYDLVIVGAGSGNMLPAEEFAGWRIAVVEADRFGGTCLNRGCIPSKMLVHTADVARTVREAGRFGIRAGWKGADWPAIRDRVFGRIDPLHERAVAHRRAGGIDVFPGEARFAGPKILRVGDDELRADRFVLAVGSRPGIPPVAGLAEVPYLTCDTVMRLDKLPKSMVVLGGGYIAAEMSHIFGSLGTKITIVVRGEHMLSRHDADVRARFTERYGERFDLRLSSAVEKVSATRRGIRADLVTPPGAEPVEAEVLLVATGRVPNSDRLDVAAAGIEVDAHGHVRTDRQKPRGKEWRTDARMADIVVVGMGPLGSDIRLWRRCCQGSGGPQPSRHLRLLGVVLISVASLVVTIIMIAFFAAASLLPFLRVRGGVWRGPQHRRARVTAAPMAFTSRSGRPEASGAHVDRKPGTTWVAVRARGSGQAP